jgi:Skp family chaperone for outer membrane proteins
MLWVWIVFSQVTADPLSGGAGWVGTGLLGSVLGWLLFIHLPKKDQQVLDLINSRDKLVEKLTTEFRQSMAELVDKVNINDREQRVSFKESLEKVTAHCEKEVNETVDALRKEVDRISGYVGEMSKKIERGV